MADEEWVLENDYRVDKLQGDTIVLQQELQDAKETIHRLTAEIQEQQRKQAALIDRSSALESVAEQQSKLKQRVDDLQQTEEQLKLENQRLAQRKEALLVEQKQLITQSLQDRVSSQGYAGELQVKKAAIAQLASELGNLNERRNRLQSAVLDLENKQTRKKKELAKYNQWFWLSVVIAIMLALGGTYVWQLFTDLQQNLAWCENALKTEQAARRISINAS